MKRSRCPTRRSPLVCPLLATPRRLSPATRCPPPATRCPPPATRRPPPATRCPPPATRRPPPATRCPPPATRRPPPATRCPPPATRCPLSCPATPSLCPATLTAATLSGATPTAASSGKKSAVLREAQCSGEREKWSPAASLGDREPLDSDGVPEAAETVLQEGNNLSLSLLPTFSPFNKFPVSEFQLPPTPAPPAVVLAVLSISAVLVTSADDARFSSLKARNRSARQWKSFSTHHPLQGTAMGGREGRG
jgi:hypothetical protein